MGIKITPNKDKNKKYEPSGIDLNLKKEEMNIVSDETNYDSEILNLEENLNQEESNENQNSKINIQKEEIKNEESTKLEEPIEVEIKKRRKRYISFKYIIGLLTLLIFLSGSFAAYKLTELYNPKSKLLEIQDIDEKIIQSFTILDRNGLPLQENGENVKYDPVKFKNKNDWNISSLYLKALIQTEDDSFFHRVTNGYSIKGTIGAAISQIKAKSGKNVVARGGSTIEQQLVKIMISGSNNKNTISDKLVQIIDGRKLALKYERNDILKAYVNELRLVPNTVGVKSASIALFGNDMSKIDETNPEHIAQVAFMAGLGQSPSVYVQNFESEGKERTKVVLGIMLNKNLIDEKVYKETLEFINDKDNKFHLKGSKQDSVPKEYQSYVSEVRNELNNLNLPTNASIKIKTYADANKLKELHSVVTGEYPIDQRIPNGYIEHKESLTAISVVDSKTGEILGLATNSDNPLISFDANRSSGSTIKPLLDYAPAVEYAGLNGNSQQNGSSFNIGDWKVINYGNENFGNVKANFALGLSLNTAAVEAFQMTNDAQKISIMEPLGLHSYNPNGSNYSPEQGINYPTNTLALASAFSSFGNDGVRVEPSAISEIEVDGVNLKMEKRRENRAMSSSTAKEVVNMLKHVVKDNGSEPYGAGKYTGFSEDTYVMKSGLSNFESSVPGGETKSPDALLAMASPEISIAVWIGSPSYVDATYAPTSAPYENSNRARSYLMNSSFGIMMNGRNSSKFKFTDQKLKQNNQDKGTGLPKIDNVVQDDGNFKPENKKITDKMQKERSDLENKYKEQSERNDKTYFGD